MRAFLTGLFLVIGVSEAWRVHRVDRFEVIKEQGCDVVDKKRARRANR